MQTLDLEFSEWAHELLHNGKLSSVDFLRVLSQYRFVWEACRQRCADLCREHELSDMAVAILKNEGE